MHVKKEASLGGKINIRPRLIFGITGYQCGRKMGAFFILSLEIPLADY